MTNMEIILGIVVTFISVVTFLDKINNRKTEKKENECRDHLHRLNNIEMALQAVQIDKVSNDDFNDIKSELSTLKSELAYVKSGIQRIENLIMEKKL